MRFFAPVRHHPLTGSLVALVLAAACAHDSPGHAEPPRHSARNSEHNREHNSALDWPLHGRVSSAFGSSRPHGAHQGIDIRVPIGTPIRAAAAGRVAFSGHQRGYGHVVIVEHARGLETRYAHNRRNRVRKGQRVDRGDLIAEAGASGNASAPHLHFEVRKAGRARDPLRYLPSHEPLARR